MTVYKFGVIGCGNVSQRHINAIRSLHNSELVAVSDSDIIKLNKVAKENNIRLKLDIEKVYFSPRLSLERMRIAELVNTSKSRESKNKKSEKKEDILVMFSGCAPYCCVIAKNAKTKVNSVIGIEINPEGHKYAHPVCPVREHMTGPCLYRCHL